jgi:predicted enzyme related to lactoylglutathione lyase
MHRSRLSTFVIDCKVEDLDAATEFWSKALGRAIGPIDDEDPLYRELEAGEGEPKLLVQQVEHDSRIHLDIEADDLEAEATRLERLGARRIKFFKRWWLMQAPTGQVFCIVNPQRGPLAGKPNANQWPDQDPDAGDPPLSRS